LIALSARAERQLDALLDHYDDLGRTEAMRNLGVALAEASAWIAANPEAGLTHPRPYPELREPGRLWRKQGRYWFSYSATTPPVISGIFYETADIPRHV
jgi:plasmid stabilization system protein ParE